MGKKLRRYGNVLWPISFEHQVNFLCPYKTNKEENENMEDLFQGKMLRLTFPPAVPSG